MIKNQRGFTITEMTLAIVVAGFLTLALFSVTFYYYADSMQASTATSLALESQSILTQLTDDIRLSDAISSTNAIYDQYSPPGGWTTSDPSNVIIIENPAVDSNHNIIYNPDTGSPYRNEYIYFVSGGVMYKRILANPDATGNTAETTCPSTVANCLPDRIFSQNVANLSFTFYDSSDNTTSDASAARSVLFTVNLSKKSFGKSVNMNNSTRVTLRNT